MPALSDLAEVGGGLLGGYLRRRGTTKAVSRYTGGLDAARGTIDAKSKDLSALNRDIYGNQQATNRDTFTGQQQRLDPYAVAGGESLESLREGVKPGGGLTDPFKFAMADLEKDPGYQFRLTEGMKILNRGANANLNRFSGGTLKAAQRFGQDYASQEFGKAYAREEGTFRANQDARYSRLRDVAGIGETAVGRENDAQSQYADREINAGNNFGDRETANQVLTSDQIANLQIEKADAEAAGDVDKSNAISEMVSTGLSLAPTVLKALGIGGTAATTAASALGATGALTGLGLGGTTIGATGALSATVPGVALGGVGGSGLAAGGAGGAAAGGISAAQAIPIVGAALAAGVAFLKSQRHWEASTATKDFENPFAQESLFPFSKEWDRAVNAGEMTREAGIQARAQYYANWEDYVKRIRVWAGNSSDKKAVANKSINNLFNKMILPQMNGIDRDLAGRLS